MADQTPEIIDVVFDLDGATLPPAYPFALWAALEDHFPQLAEEKYVGVLPLRGTTSNAGLLLPKRAKLVLRLPVSIADQAVAHLTGQQLDVGGHHLHLGAARKRPICAHPTIHADLVAGVIDEVRFSESIHAQLGDMGIKGNLICGKRRSIDDGRQTIDGFSLVVHDLKPDASLYLQYVGLGKDRRYGCGIFVPSKVISGLGED